MVYRRNLVMKKLLILALILNAFISTSIKAEDTALALNRAQSEDLATASGHYARARSLLLAAVREFDNGLKYANPDMLIDSKEWRNSLLDRAEDLEKVLAPQPRLTEGGVQFTPDSRLIGDDFRKK
jgi:hypothetical protein